MIFTIREVGTNNYVSDLSFGQYNRQGTMWTYSVFTGRCAGMRYFPSREHANEVIDQLLEKSNLLGLHKLYEPVTVHKNDLQEGEAIRIIVHK